MATSARKPAVPEPSTTNPFLIKISNISHRQSHPAIAHKFARRPGEVYVI
jgi:hypothetical protein